MPRKTPNLIILATAAVATGACLVPNVICYHKTYSVTGTMGGNAPLNDSLTPTSLPLSCVSTADLTQVNLTGFVSAIEQEYTGEIEVTDQGELQLLDEMMTAIEAGTGSSMPQGHQDNYTLLIETMVDQMQASCVEYLSESYIGCTVPSADTVCGAYLSNPTRAQYLDFDLGDDYVRPFSVNSGTDIKGADGTCHYYKNPPPQGSDTDGSSGGDGDTTTTSGQSSAGPSGDPSNDDGADDSSSGGGAVAPFGDLDLLVHCNPAHTACTYDRALIDSVFAAADVVESEGAVLRLLGPGDPGYPGVVLEDFDRGEHSTELAAAVGLQNGDIIRSVDGTTLRDTKALSSVVDKLLTTPAATLIYIRRGRTREVRIDPR